MTILANLAKLPTARTQILSSRALSLLVRILATTCKNRADAALVAATDRTVSKAAIALARLCVDPATADAVVRLGGLDRLVSLARRAGQTETVKMAAAAAVKTVSIYCSAQVKKETPLLPDFALIIIVNRQ